jgi:dethiobiotin synthetase
MRALFVAGSHTDVGKTYAACALIRAARARGLAVDALKPVVSGFDGQEWEDSDPGRLLAALGRPLTPEALEAISPLRFRAALSPPMAARLEGVRLNLAQMAEFCRMGLSASTADLMLVEGVGGVMSPIAEDATGLDLMIALGLPTVLVGGSYLGAISHTLTAIETLRSRNLPILAVVVSESGEADAPDFRETVASVAAFAGDLAVVGAARGEAQSWPSLVL